MLVYLFLFLLFLGDTFNYLNPLRIQFYLLLIFPTIYLFISVIKKKRIVIPQGSVYYFLFLLLSFASVLYAPDKQEAFETSMIYASTFFVFLIAYNNKVKFKRSFNKYCIISSVVLIAVFVANYLFNLKLFTSGTSILYYYGHNQLGNFLIIPFLAFFPRFLSFVFLVFLVISFSRTTYLALAMVTLWNLKSFIKGKLITGAFILGILTIMGTLLTMNMIDTKEKTTLGSRETYFSYALNTIAKSPIIGIGSGNFYHTASVQQTNYNENTISSHNLLLDILSENGIIGGAFFVAFIVYLMKRTKKSPYLLYFVALGIVFLFDFTHRYYSFYALWFFVAGLMLEDVKGDTFKPWVLVIFLSLLQPIIIGQIFFNLGLPDKAFFIYPLHKDAYAKAIVAAIDRSDIRTAKTYLGKFESLYSEDFLSTLKIARYYEYAGDFDKAAFYYRKTLVLRPFYWVLDRIIAEKMVNLNIKVNGTFQGRRISSESITGMVEALPKDPKKNYLIFDQIRIFCETNHLKCYNNQNK